MLRQSSQGTGVYPSHLWSQCACGQLRWLSSQLVKVLPCNRRRGLIPSLDSTAADLAHYVVEISQSLENANAREELSQEESC